MSATPLALVERFYHVVWNRADEAEARHILAEDFRFRGSLGPERVGQDGFIAYLHEIHAALSDYTCTIDDLIETTDRVGARMTFSGRHVGPLFGVAATGRQISWSGAAFFTIADQRIAALWVLGDVDAVRRQLGGHDTVPFAP